MPSQERKGLFIVIEGLDGAGTTTQSALLAEWLSKKGYRSIVTREPTQGPVGGALRDALRKRIELDEKTLAMMFFADRLDHLFNPHDGIAQILRDEKTAVISDRYSLSTFAYQTMEGKLDLDWLINIHSVCLRPDLTFFVDVPALESARRITQNRGFHLERYEETRKIDAIRNGYLRAVSALNQRGENIQVVDGMATIDQVESRIRQRVDEFLKIFELGRVGVNDAMNLFKKNIPDETFWAYGREFLEMVVAERLKLISAKKISYGLQISVSDGINIIYVNFYTTKTVVVNGKENALKTHLDDLITHLNSRHFGVEEEKSGYIQVGLF